jgi:hypothetical protein
VASYEVVIFYDLPRLLFYPVTPRPDGNSEGRVRSDLKLKLIWAVIAPIAIRDSKSTRPRAFKQDLAYRGDT